MYDIKKGTNQFYIGDSEENSLAKITFVKAGENQIIADGTYVSDQLRGQGIGSLLLAELAKWARTENKKIVPVCPFVKAQMEKYPEYHDLKASGQDG